MVQKKTPPKAAKKAPTKKKPAPKKAAVKKPVAKKASPATSLTPRIIFKQPLLGILLGVFAFIVALAASVLFSHWLEHDTAEIIFAYPYFFFDDDKVGSFGVYATAFAACCSVLTLKKQQASWASALVIFALIFGSALVAFSFYSSQKKTEILEAATEYKMRIQKRNQGLKDLVTFSDMRFELSCLHKDRQLEAIQGKAYEQVKFFMPVTIKEPGKYRVLLEFASTRNSEERYPIQVREFEFDEAGEHEVTFELHYENTGGMFLKDEGSLVGISVERYYSMEDIYGEVPDTLAVFQDPKKRRYNRVATTRYPFSGLTHITFENTRSLTCPDTELVKPQ
jgi:hypothetical protein